MADDHGKAATVRDVPSTTVLALARTALASERTALAYYRTGLGFAASGFGLIQFLRLTVLDVNGTVLLGLSLVFFVVGTTRYLTIRKLLNSLSPTVHDEVEDLVGPEP